MKGHLAPETVTKMMADKMPLRTIARRHGCSVSWLRRVLRDHSLYCFGRVEPFMLKG